MNLNPGELRLLETRLDDLTNEDQDNLVRMLLAENTPHQDFQTNGLLSFSDDALALRFSECWQHNLKYDPSCGWLRWDGRRWVKVLDVQAFGYVRDVLREISQSNSLTLSRKESMLSARTVAAVLTLAKSDKRHLVKSEDFDRDPFLLNTIGGTFNLKTGEMHPHSRENFISKMTNVSPGGPCPIWNQFLDRVTSGNLDLKSYLKRLIGYSLTGNVSEQILAFLHGFGANGKTTLISILQSFLGDYATTVPIEILTEHHNEPHPTGLAKLAGVRLAIASEVSEGARWNETRLKMLTGGDTITARYMRQDYFDFRPILKLFICGNHKPSFRSIDESIIRRLHLVPFGVTIPPEERDPRLKEKLESELGGILLWAIEGCLEWQKIGLRPPSCVTLETHEYLSSEDSVQQWIDSDCIVGATLMVGSSRAYASFKRFKETTGEGVPSQKRFIQQLKSKGFMSDKSNKARFIVGLDLRSLENGI